MRASTAPSNQGSKPCAGGGAAAMTVPARPGPLQLEAAAAAIAPAPTAALEMHTAATSLMGGLKVHDATTLFESCPGDKSWAGGGRRRPRQLTDGGALGASFHRPLMPRVQSLNCRQQRRRRRRRRRRPAAAV